MLLMISDGKLILTQRFFFRQTATSCLETDRVVVVEVYEASVAVDGEELQHLFTDIIGSAPVESQGFEAAVLLDDFRQAEIDEDNFLHGSAEHHVIGVDVHVHDLKAMKIPQVF